MPPGRGRPPARWCAPFGGRCFLIARNSGGFGLTNFLIRLFVKNPADTRSRGARAAYGALGSGTGIAVNVLLSATKFLVGLLSGSLAVTADAVNNLSDAAGSVMALVSVRIAGKPVDREHPYGHGRMEYIGALAVGVLIIVAGVKLLMEGANGILEPAALTVSVLTLALLTASVLAKVWLYFFYRRLARAIDSQPLYAAAKDSLSDVVATSAVVVSVLLQKLFGWRVDGYMSVLVALFVLKTGISILRDTVSRLLGGKPNPELTQAIRDKLTAYDGILGVHDLAVHDYGPGRCIASVHAEVSAKGDIVAVHEIIDRAERELQAELGVEVLIHMDPMTTDDEAANALHSGLVALLHDTDARLTMHDFQLVRDPCRTSVKFDCALPENFAERDALLTRIRAFVTEREPRAELAVRFDHDFS